MMHADATVAGAVVDPGRAVTTAAGSLRDHPGDAGAAIANPPTHPTFD